MQLDCLTACHPGNLEILNFFFFFNFPHYMPNLMILPLFLVLSDPPASQFNSLRWQKAACSLGQESKCCPGGSCHRWHSILDCLLCAQPPYLVWVLDGKFF